MCNRPPPDPITIWWSLVILGFTESSCHNCAPRDVGRICIWEVDLIAASTVDYLHCWLLVLALLERNCDWWPPCFPSLCALSVKLGLCTVRKLDFKRKSSNGMGLHKSMIRRGPFLETSNHKLDLAYTYPRHTYIRITVCDIVRKMPKLRLSTLYSVLHPAFEG